MGRPINYKIKGGDTDKDGEQFVLRAWFTGQMAAEDAFIVKQLSTTRFLLAANANSSRTGIFTLGPSPVQGSVATLSVEPFGATQNIGFGATAVTLVTGGATAVPDGTYSVSYQTETDEWIVISVEVVGGVFTEINSIEEAGVSIVDLTGQTLEFSSVGMLITENPTVTIVSMAPVSGQKVEFATKILQHRVITSEGNSYVYRLGGIANETGEADVASA